MIRDRLVLGLKDERQAEKLQLDSELTLEKVVKQARQSEAVKKQQSVIRNDVNSDQGKVDAVQGKYVNKTSTYQQRKPFRWVFKKNSGLKTQNHSKTKPPEMKIHKPSLPSTCSRCGYSPNHARELCPAKDKTCSKCKRRGHFYKCCRAQVGEVHEESAFLGEIGCRNSNPWLVNLQVETKW